MPNWAFGFMTIKGEKDDIKVFLDLLLDHDKRISMNKKRYFARSWLNSRYNILDEYDNENKTLSIFTQHAWSFQSCMMKSGGYYQDHLKDIENGENTDRLVCIEDICKELNLEIQARYSEEGIGFTEEYWFNNKGELEFEEEIEIPQHLCYDCEHRNHCFEEYNVDVNCEDWPKSVIDECKEYKEKN